MKMIISKQDKVKRLLLLQHVAQVPEEEDEIGHGRQNPSVNSKKKLDSEEEDKE